MLMKRLLHMRCARVGVVGWGGGRLITFSVVSVVFRWMGKRSGNDTFITFSVKWKRKLLKTHPCGRGLRQSAKTMSRAPRRIFPSSLLLSDSVTNSRLQKWNLSRSVNPTYSVSEVSMKQEGQRRLQTGKEWPRTEQLWVFHGRGSAFSFEMQTFWCYYCTLEIIPVLQDNS